MQREQTISGCPTSDQFTAFYHPRAPICHGYPVPGDLYNLAATRKMLIIDVREAEELSAGSIPGAIGIPRGLIEMAADTAFRGHHRVLCTAHSKTVCCVCDCPSAGRSSLAAWTLQNMQFQDVCFLKGGIPLWLADGYPLEPLLNPAYSVMRKS
ncbi:MAG: rhodanese-like domain-containing protein [Acidithiobacillus sp.]